jgi:pimeloyl-ACP methyl ester carboxylesterase
MPDIASPPVVTPDDFRCEMLRIGDLQMNAALEGDVGNPLIVMLHGFPEFWYSWRYQIKPLAAAGYRVVAPDMRGYNLTDKTPPYDMFTVANDIVRLIHVLGEQKAIIVGHDWGGMIAWVLGMMHPDVVSRLIVCNLPHPFATIRAQTTFFFRQWLKSWYIAYFQLPLLPEWTLRARNYEALLRSLRDSIPSFSSDDEALYRAAWSQPGALPAMLGYYRSLLRARGLIARLKQAAPITMPATLIWGAPDFALDIKLAEWSVDFVPHLKLSIIPQSSHFVQQRHPTEVTRLILEFLTASAGAPQP